MFHAPIGRFHFESKLELLLFFWFHRRPIQLVVFKIEINFIFQVSPSSHSIICVQNWNYLITLLPTDKEALGSIPRSFV